MQENDRQNLINQEWCVKKLILGANRLRIVQIDKSIQTFRRYQNGEIIQEQADHVYAKVRRQQNNAGRGGIEWRPLFHIFDQDLNRSLYYREDEDS